MIAFCFFLFEIVFSQKREDQYEIAEVFMRDHVEHEMYRRAVELIEARYPTGWGGAGVVHTSRGNYYTSVSIETANEIGRAHV